MEIYVGTEIKIKWDAGWNPRSYFDEGSGVFKVSDVVKVEEESEYPMLEKIRLKNGEAADKEKKYHCYKFDVRFENKEPLYEARYEIRYFPEMIKKGKKSLWISCLTDNHLRDDIRKICFENLNITDSWITKFNKLQ